MVPGGGHAGPRWDGASGTTDLQSSELQRPALPTRGLWAVYSLGERVGGASGPVGEARNQLGLALPGGSSDGSRGARCGRGQGGTGRKGG